MELLLASLREAARESGQRLKLTTANGVGHQVMCVTHLPQLAGFGDRHFKIEKQIVPSTGAEPNGERTVTTACVLDGDAQVDELAHMLGVNSASTQDSAREILAQVAQAKSL